MNPATGDWDIWAVDVRSGIPARLTTRSGIDTDAVWSPDGSEIAYLSLRPGAPGIYRMSIADGREQLLLKSTSTLLWIEGLRITHWTRDGRYLVYDADGNIMALPLHGTRTPIAVAASAAEERSGKVSPDGRWLAYQSRDSDEWFVYVQPFPGAGSRTRVSAGTGLHPQWRADGAELFWVGRVPGGSPNEETLYSAELGFTGGTVTAAPPKPVFPSHVGMTPLIDNRSHYLATADGQRFLIRQPAGPTGPSVKLILHWKEQLRAP
jgi:Tol biopolymer transport system component